MSEIPKKANKSIRLLEGLVEQLHFFYGDNPEKFKKHVLKDAIEIENNLKDLAINKKETFKRISKRYEEYYRKRADIIDTANVDIDDSIRKRYRSDIKKDRK